MTLGKRVRQRRLEKGMSAVELSEAAGISKGYLSELETGHATRPSGAVLLKIAKALGTTIADLLDQEVHLQPRSVNTSLKEFAREAQLPEQDIQMLAQIRFRGAQPTSVDDWRFLYESIRRSMPKGRPD